MGANSDDNFFSELRIIVIIIIINTGNTFSSVSKKYEWQKLERALLHFLPARDSGEEDNIHLTETIVV